jgi:hypothetical protein
MSASTTTPETSAAAGASGTAETAPAATWEDIATKLSLLAMDLMDAREQADAETDPVKKAAIEADIERMENEYAELFVTYEATPYEPEEEEEDRYADDGWDLDYENGQGCADW